MYKQIVKIGDFYYLRKRSLFGWIYASRNCLKSGDEHFWRRADYPFPANCKFSILEELEQTINEYPMKRKEKLDEDKTKNKPQVIKTLWFKKL